jgi:hypothetical protein
MLLVRKFPKIDLRAKLETFFGQHGQVSQEAGSHRKYFS